MAEHAHVNVAHGEAAKPQTKRILQVFLILLIITALEFVVALGLDLNSSLKAAIFIGMTIVKAFYIVADFMHLRHEVKILIWCIILPMMFICWLVLALITEGGSHFH